MNTYICVYNPASGSSPSRKDIRDKFPSNNVEIIFYSVSDSDATIKKEIQKRNIDGIIAAGGDGTVNRCLSICVENNKTLGILPCGTLNHFAKDLGIEMDLEKAAQTIINNRKRKVDYCSVNSKLFVNNSSIGLYPETVKWRENNEHKYGKWLSAFMASVIFLRKHKTVKVKTINGSTSPVKTPMIFIGNNEYDISSPGIASREDLDRGKLFLCCIKSNSTMHFIKLIVPTFFGRGLSSKNLIISVYKEVNLEFEQENITIGVDGEAINLQSPLQYKIFNKGLSVFAPC